MEGLKTRSEVRDAYKERKTPALKALLDEMEELGQERIKEETFLKAYHQKICGKCGEGLRDNHEGNYCNECKDKIKREQYRASLAEHFEKLTDDLNRIAGKDLYKFKEKKDTYNWNITRRSENGVDYCEIIRKAVYSSGSWRSHKSALKIRTNHWEFENNRLQKDFDDKNVAKNLHKHCTKLLEAIEARRAYSEELEDTEKKLKEDLMKRFPEATDIRTKSAYKAVILFTNVSVYVSKYDDGDLSVNKVDPFYVKVGDEKIRALNALFAE